MSNIDNMLESTSANQDLFVDLNEKDAETVSGGTLFVVEQFTIRNETDVLIPYAVDGTRTSYPDPGSVSDWTAYDGGIVAFDYDFGLPGVQLREYDLAHGDTYAFRYDTRTDYPNDIELFNIT
jgi:hypothetical protein